MVPLALGLFQDLGTTRPDDDPPVAWVKGVAITRCCYPDCHRCQVPKWLAKGKQFEGLNQKRKEYSVRVVCDGRKRLIHVHDHDVVMGDIVLLEPSGLIPCTSLVTTYDAMNRAR